MNDRSGRGTDSEGRAARPSSISRQSPGAQMVGRRAGGPRAVGPVAPRLRLEFRGSFGVGAMSCFACFGARIGRGCTSIQAFESPCRGISSLATTPPSAIARSSIAWGRSCLAPALRFHNTPICAPDRTTTGGGLPLLKLPIAVADGAWICADAFVGSWRDHRRLCHRRRPGRRDKRRRGEDDCSR